MFTLHMNPHQLYLTSIFYDFIDWGVKGTPWTRNHSNRIAFPLTLLALIYSLLGADLVEPILWVYR